MPRTAKAFTMKMETARFQRHINSIIRKNPGKAKIVIKKVAITLIRHIVLKNPVDTGRSRAGWYPAMRGLGFTGAESLLEKGRGQSQIVQHEVAKGKKEGDYKESFVTFGAMYVDLINNVKYILLLEYGASHQAPYGMVRISMRQIGRDILPKEMRTEIRKLWNMHF